MRTKEELMEDAQNNRVMHNEVKEVQIEVLIDIRDCLLELIKLAKEAENK